MHIIDGQILQAGRYRIDFLNVDLSSFFSLSFYQLLAMHGDGWRDLVNVVMNLRVL